MQEMQKMQARFPSREDPLSPVFLPGKFHGQRNLVGYSSWGRKESDMTEQLSTVQCTTKSDNLNEMDKILERYKVVKPTQEETGLQQTCNKKFN